MTIEMPPTSKSLGRKVVVFLDTPPAAPDGIPTRTEVNAAMFASLHLYTPFSAQPTQNTGEGPRKLGATVVPEENGLVKFPSVEIQYSYKPQSLGTVGADGNELYELLVEGTKRTVVVFDDLDGDVSAIPANAVGDVYLCDPGKRRKGTTGDGEFDQFAAKQSLVIAGGQPIAEDHVFA